MYKIKHPKDKTNLEKYLKKLIAKEMTPSQIAIATGYTATHIGRLKKKYIAKGREALINGHTGMTPAHKVKDETRRKIIEIYKTDFCTESEKTNFKLFQKCLAEDYCTKYSYTTIYKLLTNAGIKSPEQRRVKHQNVHRPRQRRSQEGDLIQIDASPYQWFHLHGDKNYYSLHGAIDDATGKITALYMTQNECSYGYFELMEQTIKAHGIPNEIYSDRASIFCVTPRKAKDLTIQEQLQGLHEKRTQWQRMLANLHIKQILAWMPQAKGRIERLWRTLQGRLPWLFKLRKIKTPEQANKYFKEVYIEDFAKEFSRKARNEIKAWREPCENYKDELCARFERQTNSAGVISFQGYSFQVKMRNCAKKKIELCIYSDGIKALYKGKHYDVKMLDDEVTTVLGDAMSGAMQSIIYEYMFKNAKRVSA